MSGPPDATLSRWLSGLPEPVKNRFFYGMLLNEHTLTRDQSHFEAKRWLLNRLALGTGVLAGLNYRTAGDSDTLLALTEDELIKAEPTGNAPVWFVRLAPGVAVDGYGREVVVPSTGCADGLVRPVRVTDAGGKEYVPGTDKDYGGFVTAARSLIGGSTTDANPFHLVMEIRYDPEPIDPAPIRAGTCPTRCESSATREGFEVRFRPVKELPGPIPGAVGEELRRSDGKWPAGSLLDVFPQEPAEAVRHRQFAHEHADLAAVAVPPQPDPHPVDPCAAVESWVPLGVFKCEVPGRDAAKLTITHVGRYYRQLFANDALSRLVFGLAERVDEAARVRVLTLAGVDGASSDGQAADVYHELDKPLVVKVVDSTGGPLKVDRDSVRVQFDLLSASEGADLLKGDGTNKSVASTPLDLANDGTVRVRWKLGKRPGPHTVTARIVPADTARPPFHPGSQVVFHATARPTAPTVVGMDVLHWQEHHGGCIRWKHGKAVLRVFFSRKMDEAALKHPQSWLRVWRMVGDRSARSAEGGDQQTVDLQLGPEPMRDVSVADGPHPVGNSGDERACWFVDYRVHDLLKHLCESDTLRVLVMIRPTGALKSVVFDSPLFPVAQELDADFDGSFASPKFRDLLWTGNPAADDGVADGIRYFNAFKPDDWDKLPPVAEKALTGLRDLWHRFQPREYPFPSGDGIEELDLLPDQTLRGGDFHKAFELRLPRC